MVAKTIARPKFRCRTVLMRSPKPHRLGNLFDNWIKAPPFFVNPRGQLVHRVHSACTVLPMNDRYGPHGGVSYLCGNQVCFKLKDAHEVFVADPPRDRFVCARCEVVAALQGMASASDLAGRHVHRGVMVPQQLCCRRRKEPS